MPVFLSLIRLGLGVRRAKWDPNKLRDTQWTETQQQDERQTKQTKKKLLERKENGGGTFRKACHDEDDREMRGVMKPNVRDLADDEKE